MRKYYLSPRIEVLHYLSNGDPALEAFVLLDLCDLVSGWFLAQIPTEEHSRAGLFSGRGSKRVVHPIVLHLPTNRPSVKTYTASSWAAYLGQLSQPLILCYRIYPHESIHSKITVIIGCVMHHQVVRANTAHIVNPLFQLVVKTEQ